MTRIWKALAATLLGGAMVLGFGASPASAQSFGDLVDGCEQLADTLSEELLALCDGLQELADQLADGCEQLADATDPALLELCALIGGEQEQEPEPTTTTTTTAPAPPPTEPPAPPATEAPAPAPAATGALPSTGGTGAGIALLAGGVLAAGALALRRFVAT